MILQIQPCFNQQWTLDTLSVSGDTIHINGTPHHLPSLSEDYDQNWFCGLPQLVDGIWVVRLIYPYSERPTSKVKPLAPINISQGAVELPISVV